MRKSKKLIALSMAALMTAMTGCSGGQTASTQAESAAETQPAGTEAESAGAAKNCPGADSEKQHYRHYQRAV